MIDLARSISFLRCREAELNHRHGDFQLRNHFRRFSTIFKPLDIKYLKGPSWDTLGYVGKFSVLVVTV